MKRRLPEPAVLGFLAPNFLGFCTFLLFPIILSLWMSVTNWSLKPAVETEFLGLRNFTDLLGVRALGAARPAVAWGYVVSAGALFLALVGTLLANVAGWRGCKLGGVVLAGLGVGILAQKVAAWLLARAGQQATVSLLGLELGLGGGQAMLIAAGIALLGGIAVMGREEGDWQVGMGTLPPLLLAAAAGGLWLLHRPMWAAYEATDPRFWQYFYNTLYLMMGIPFAIAGSLALAMLLNESLPLGRWRPRVLGVGLCLACGAVTLLLVWNLGKSWAIFRDDLRSPAALAAKLRDGKDGVSAYIRQRHVAARTLSMLDAGADANSSDAARAAIVRELNRAIVRELNKAIEDPDLYGEARFSDVKLSDETRQFMQRHPAPDGADLLHRNRLLLQDAYREEIAECSRVGHPNLALLGAIFWAMAAMGIGFNVVSFRTLFYLPTFTAGVALMILWKALYNPQTGPINVGLGTMFESVGYAPQAIEGMLPEWLADVEWAKPALIIMGVWTAIGGTNMLLYLAGLSNIPLELLDAARVDGAGRWARFRHVIWPQLAPTTFFISVMSIIGGLQGGFEQARVMTQGGPAGSTTTLSYYIYNKFFEDLDLGYAAAISWILFAVIFIATAINWRFGKKLEVVE